MLSVQTRALQHHLVLRSRFYFTIFLARDLRIISSFEFKPTQGSSEREAQWLTRSSSTFTANDRNDHVTMFTLYLSLDVLYFSVKLSSSASASKVRIILHYFHLCTIFVFEKT